EEEGAGEQVVPGDLSDDPDRQAVVRIRASVAILYCDVTTLEVGCHTREQRVEFLLGYRPIAASPADFSLGSLFLDEELALRRAAGVDAGLDYKRAGRGQQPFTVSKRHFVEVWNRQIPIDISEVLEAKRLKTRIRRRAVL